MSSSEDAPDSGSFEAPDAGALRPGRITALVPQTDPRRTSVFLDGRFAFGIHTPLVERAGLTVGSQLSIEAQEALLAEERIARVLQKALHFIAHQPRTEAEVVRRLGRSGASDGQIDEVIRRLRGGGALDDSAYVRAYVESRLQRQGYGPRRIEAELVRRGIARETVKAALETFAGETNTLETALEQATKRWMRLEKEPDVRKRRKKLVDFLVRRGFSFDTAHEAMRRVAGDMDAD